MLDAAFIALLIAVLFGSWLAILHFDGRTPARTPWPLALMHAALALGGFVLLAASLTAPPRGADQGTAAFGLTAVALFAAAIAAGLGIFVRFRVRKKSASALVGVHASLAVCAIVILAAYVLSG